jgi:hypothetical protein
VKFYNLDIILAIGYRVRSHIGLQFRNWATNILTEDMERRAIAEYAKFNARRLKLSAGITEESERIYELSNAK